jgi:chemotaxis protein CheX
MLQDARTENAVDEDERLVLRLPAVLDLKAAAPLAAAFLGRRGEDLRVDAGDVQRIGGQCLQILLSAHSAWVEDRRSMTIANATPQFCSAIELFGAGPALSFYPKEPG